jgi:class 3 adenylate cyclase
VLFADITGFTALSERLDPEQVTETVNRRFLVLTLQFKNTRAQLTSTWAARG